MNSFRSNFPIFFSSLFFICLLIYFIITSQSVFLIIIPVALLILYTSIFHTKLLFVSIAFLTPFSVNIEEYTNGVGLFIPTEPILFGLLLLFIFFQIQKKVITNNTLKHPIVLSIFVYLFSLFICSITSTSPIISFKSLLSKLWFIIPLVFLGSVYFKEKKTIRQFLFLFVFSVFLVVLYTIIHHASYNFGEQEGHWVMWPFFKDHTIYGAIIAMALPLSIGLLFSKKHDLLLKCLYGIIILVILIGLYFSYTRAAWLSVVGALFVFVFLKYKVKFKYLFITAICMLAIIFMSWDNIQMELKRNKFEHTTEEFGERIQSAANVSTDASNLERINRWECAIEMFKERPVFGFGPGTYSFEYARYQKPESLTIISTNFGNMGNAHSEYLSALSETGIIGFFSFILVVAIIFYSSIKLYLKTKDLERKTLLLFMILSLSTYFIHAFLNNFLDTDKAAVPIWGMCAMIIALEKYLPEKEKTTLRN
ncbi:MAG: O-antigen ligase family protein [Crocinitomicaceae bacterium]|nr:O-antigen ligase family protein [Crocinitomicaceae bacterium]